MQERLLLLTAALARGTPPAFTPEQLQESRGGVTAGAAEDAPSTPHTHKYDPRKDQVTPPPPGISTAQTPPRIRLLLPTQLNKFI